jgi:hypothetical protein
MAKFFVKRVMVELIFKVEKKLVPHISLLIQKHLKMLVENGV